MVAERDLGRAELARDAVEHAAPQPRAQRAHRPAFRNHALDDAVGVLLDDAERDAARLEIARQHVGREARLLLVEVDRDRSRTAAARAPAATAGCRAGRSCPCRRTGRPSRGRRPRSCRSRRSPRRPGGAGASSACWPRTRPCADRAPARPAAGRAASRLAAVRPGRRPRLRAGRVVGGSVDIDVPDRTRGSEGYRSRAHARQAVAIGATISSFEPEATDADDPRRQSQGRQRQDDAGDQRRRLARRQAPARRARRPRSAAARRREWLDAAAAAVPARSRTSAPTRSARTSKAASSQVGRRRHARRACTARTCATRCGHADVMLVPRVAVGVRHGGDAALPRRRSPSTRRVRKGDAGDRAGRDARRRAHAQRGGTRRLPRRMRRFRWSRTCATRRSTSTARATARRCSTCRARAPSRTGSSGGR